MSAFGNGARGTAELAVATFGAAAVAMLTSMVLTRAMTPEDFGAYRYVIAIVGLAAIVVNVGIPYSAARLLAQKSATEHTRIVAASAQLMLVAVFAGALLLCLVSLAVRPVSDIAHLLIIAAALLWTTALQRFFMYSLRGAGRTRDIAVQTMLPPIITLGASIVLAVAFQEISLAAVLAVVGASYLGAHMATAVRLGILRERRLGAERSFVLATQRETGVPIYKGALVSVGAAELVVVLGGAMVGESDFGHFSLALSLASPAATLPAVVGMVQFRAFGASGRLTRRTLWSTTVRSGLLAVVGVGAGWLIFPLMFPADFGAARMMFPALTIGFLMHGLADYLNQFMQAQGAGLALKRASYCVGVAGLIVGATLIPFIGVWGLVATKVAGGLIYITSMLFLVWRWHHARR